ncbi:MAG: SDH family Clp fold serine proteinase [Devosia sp.]
MSVSLRALSQTKLTAARRANTPTQLNWDGLGGNGAELRDRKRSRLKSEKISPPMLHEPGGLSEKMADDHPGSNSYIETELTRRIKELEAHLKSDVITCVVPIQQPVDDLIRDAVEDIHPKQSALTVILETDGGSIETAERIANVFRHHYPSRVSFVVPNFAMSAGTILVMSGDDIYMDYYSVLGPIDPQVPNQNGTYVPALGYLEKYKQLIGKSNKGALTAAELTFLIEKFDPAELHRFEQARDHSVDLLKQWLVQYKFKNWTKTRSKGLTVTPAMKTKRAEEIARKLNDTKRWRSHGRGLSMSIIDNELNLLVEDCGQMPAINKEIRDYYRLMQDYMGRRSHLLVVHTKEKYLAF